MIIRIAQPVYLAEIFLCLIFSAFFYKKGTRAEKWLVPFFAALLCVESYAMYRSAKWISTSLLYNFWFPGEFIFYSLFISSFIQSPVRIKVIRYGVYIYALFVAMSYIFVVNLVNFASTVFLIGVLLILPVCFMKLYEEIEGEVMQHPFKNPLFWFITGLLIENIGSFFILGSINLVKVKNEHMLMSLYDINIIATCMQYFSFLLYFYCRWKYQR